MYEEKKSQFSTFQDTPRTNNLVFKLQNYGWVSLDNILALTSLMRVAPWACTEYQSTIKPC